MSIFSKKKIEKSISDIISDLKDTTPHVIGEYNSNFEILNIY
jgi:hypothetical protein